MTQLRRKLELNPARPRHLLTESGMGYSSSLEDGTGRPLADCTPTRRARYRAPQHPLSPSLSPVGPSTRASDCRCPFQCRRMRTCRIVTWEPRRGHGMIRRPEDGPVAVTGARGLVPGRWRTGRAARLAGAGPVSYTHLRAH